MVVDGPGKTVLEAARTAADSTRLEDPREAVTTKVEVVACGDESVDECSREAITSHHRIAKGKILGRHHNIRETEVGGLLL